MAAQRSQFAQPIFWIASTMFFLSGGTGLAYQVIWFKRFAHVWGSSSLAFASVGASFLFGLGLGAYLIGRRTDNLPRPLRWYGICELVIGALALVIPFEIQWLIEFSAQFYSQLPQDPIWRYLVQFAITLLVIGPPCVLMGGTLPLLIRELTAREGSIDQATGWLYAINTFGAAAGCFLAGFVLLPHFGLAAANNMAAALNITIGVVSLLVSQGAVRRARGPAKQNDITEQPAPGLNLGLMGLLIAVTLSGLGALILEMTWSRQLALTLGGSTYAYSSTLFVVLVGIAAGSLLFHLALRHFASSPWLPIIVIGLVVASCMVGELYLPQLAVFAGDNRAARGEFWSNVRVCLLAAMLLELVPSIAMGVLFPLFVHLTNRTAAAVGRTVGDVYAWNTFGSIVGASLTSVLLFPWIGTGASIALAAGLYVLALLLVLPIRTAGEIVTAGLCLLVGVGMVSVILMPADPMLTNMGMYMYGNQGDRLSQFRPLYFAEGASSNVLITQASGANTNLRVNGKVDASDDLDMLMQLGLAYFPRMFKPQAKEVLVIGFGSGTTSGGSLMFPGTRVTCCEIEPAVYRAASKFGHVNHRPYEKTREFLIDKRREKLPAGEELSEKDLDEIEREARFNIIFGDGRSALQGSDKKFDLILSEPSNPWLAGVSNLFTEEFFDAASKHLNEGGVLAQWIQTYNFDIDDYLMIVRTLRTRFKHCGLVTLAEGADTILLASNSPLAPTPASIKQMQDLIDNSPEMTKDFLRWYGTTDVRLLLMRFYTVGEQALVARVEGVPKPKQWLNTDLNMKLEFAAPLHLFKPPVRERDARLQITGLTSPQWRAELGRSMGLSPDSAEFKLVEAEQSLKNNKFDEALAQYRGALEIDPKSINAYRGVAVVYIKQQKHPQAIAVLRDLLKLQPSDANALLTLGQEYLNDKQSDQAIATFKQLLEIEPKNVQALKFLSQQYLAAAVALTQAAAQADAAGKADEARTKRAEAQARHEEAVGTLARLVEIQPENSDAHGTLGQEYISLKRNREAIDELRKALSMNSKLGPKSPALVWANNLAWLLATTRDDKLRNGDEAVDWAKKVCEAVEYKQMEFLDTLAAAYAETGNFDEAIKLSKKFLDHAEAAGNAQAVQMAQSRVKLFESKQPYRES